MGHLGSGRLPRLPRSAAESRKGVVDASSGCLDGGLYPVRGMAQRHEIPTVRGRGVDEGSIFVEIIIKFIKYDNITAFKSRHDLRQDHECGCIEVGVQVEDDAALEFAAAQPARQGILKEAFDEAATRISDLGGFAVGGECSLGP